MSITTYSYPKDKDKQLSEHFKMGEFVASSDYYDIGYPSSVPVDDKLLSILEEIRAHFNCDYAIISSGYRTPACDMSVGGSGSGYHTKGMAADVQFVRNGSPIPSRIIACYAQDIGVKGIGYYCGGAEFWTHLDTRSNTAWFGDERDYSCGYNDYYSYTGTKESEVYPNGTASTASSGVSSVMPAATAVTSAKKNLTTSQAMVDIIKEQEGLSLKACKAIPSEEYWTIGYGHYGAEVGANQTITEPEAEALLKSDLKVFENAVNSAVKVGLTQSQFDACISLAYNIGTGAFANSDIVKNINGGKFGHACVDFPSWRKAGGQILAGLFSRRQIEMDFFGLGEEFTITNTMNIRSGPGTNNSIRKVSQITANGRECVVDKTTTANAMFKPGTVVTALELKAIHTTAKVEVWLRCPSGWICARDGDDVYVN